MKSSTRFHNTIFLTSVTFLVLLFCGIASAQVAPDTGAKIDEYMTAGMKYAQYNGAVLVAADGKPIIAKGYGMANFEHEAPITPQTKFRIGSVTKQFTSMLIMMLQEKGKLKVEDPICKYLADCPPAWAEITIHNVLTHTSGIFNYTGLPNMVDLMPQAITPAKLIGLVKDKPLDFKPGEKYNYSNTGYVVLGAIIEKVTEKPYAVVLKENILDPLKMTNTGYDVNTEVLKHRAAGYSHLGSAIRNSRYVDMTVPYSAGSIYSTVEDLLIWDQALYTEKLVSKKSLDAIFTPFLSNYGYGWRISQQFGHKVIGHSGGISGFSAFIARFPTDKITIIVLLNFDDLSGSKIANDLAAIVFGQKYEIPQERKETRTEIKVDPKILSSYVGEYELRPGFLIKVTTEGDHIFVAPASLSLFEIFATSETTFFAKMMDIQITFVKDEKGEVSHLVLRRDGRDSQAKKVKP